MQLSTITMDRTEARQAFLEYRDAVRARHDAELAQIMRGYRALAAGQQLIHLTDTLHAGGLNAQGYPALAVARADRRWAWLEVNPHGAVSFLHHNETPSNAGPAAGTWRFPAGTMQALGATSWKSVSAWWGGGLRAMVPLVPPGLRPAHSLAGYALLWEVEQWEQAPQPPGDPALLKPIGGDLYAVVAVWDLTPLERAVLSGRRPTT